MAEQDWQRESLVTFAVSKGELRTIRNAAAARGKTVSGWLRELLRAQLVDLAR
jgi:hypothetical protein